MTFGTTLALLVGLLVGLPVAAHLLRRGRTIEVDFPPAHLVPTAVVTSDKRSRLEDRMLFALRALAVLLLAVLGATPFVRCTHLSVNRQAGASVGLAIVLDDSQSMRAVTAEGKSRFDLAKSGALQLLDSAREGDAISLIAAGTPARLLFNASTDLKSARAAIEQLTVTDRGTDLDTAVALARSVLKDLPHQDRRVALLSDDHDEPIVEGEPKVWSPLRQLALVVDNCGITEAVQQGQEAVVTVACNTDNAAKSRTLAMVKVSSASEVLEQRVLEPRQGVQNLTFTGIANDVAVELGVRILESDGIERDNAANVSRVSRTLAVGLMTERLTGSGATGGATLIEQAVAALDPDLNVKPLTQVPDNAEQLRELAALILDDPRGLSPDERAVLDEWLNRGGILLGLLGPNSASAELAANSEPFARPGIQWEATKDVTLDVKSLAAFLGADAANLDAVQQRGRMRLDAADLPNTVIRGKWSDGVPWLFERRVGLGVVFTVGLPSTLQQSELALRPGFLALLDVALERSRARSGSKRAVVGVPWRFPAQTKVDVLADAVKSGAVVASTVAVSGAGDQGSDDVNRFQQEFTPTLTGLYALKVDDREEWRTATLEAKELLQLPNATVGAEEQSNSEFANVAVDASPYWALVVLALFSFELGYRVLRARMSKVENLGA
jgi:hypothetical protein